MTKLAQIVDTGLAFLVGLTPGALGAAVSLAYEKGLTWADRFTQFAVGTVVSWFAGRVVGAMLTLDPFVLQGVSFTLGMIAFRATPRFASGMSDLVAEVPVRLRDLLPFFKRKDPGQ